jgi:flagellar hook protein FlgE
MQDGAASSRLQDISIDSDGIISGIYDNGTVHALAQLALSTFPNDEGLLKFKGTTFVQYGNSGEPSIGAPGTGGRGSISGSSLEQSNVDIATEFTNLIIHQRGYQANSRVITTTDELDQEAINLIR